MHLMIYYTFKRKLLENLVYIQNKILKMIKLLDGIPELLQMINNNQKKNSLM